MKNIHALPTDKPTRLFTSDSVLILAGYPATTFKTGKNIYITSDEEVNKTDYVIVSCSEAEIEEVNLVTEYYTEQFLFDDKTQIHMDYCRKIILTTDPELIADGVQTIDDEFLEWYVKNPNCEEVKTEITDISCLIPNFGDVDKYKIIIPNDFTIKTRVSRVEYSEQTKKVVEEHNLMYDKVIEFINNNIEEFDKALELHRRKKHIINIMKADEELGLYEEPYGINTTQHTPKEEMLVEIKTKLYSKEDMEQAFIEGHNVCRYFTDNTDEAKECFNEWFNKFKK